MKANQILEQTGLSIEEIFDVPQLDNEIESSMIQVYHLVREAINNNDVNNIDSIITGGNRSTSIFESIITQNDNTLSAAEDWKELAIKFFDLLPLEKQIELLPDIPQNVFRVAIINEVINDLV